MVEPADVRCGDDFTGAVFNLARHWRVGLKTQMTARLVVVGRVSKQDPHEVTFAEGDDVIGAFSPDGTDNAFDVRILPR